MRRLEWLGSDLTETISDLTEACLSRLHCHAYSPAYPRTHPEHSGAVETAPGRGLTHAGRAATLSIASIERVVAQMYSFCCSKKVMEPENIARGNQWLIGMLEANNVELPAGCDWVEKGQVPRNWWKGFFQRYPHLSTGYARSVEEARLSAHSEAALREWTGRVLGTGPDADEWRIKGWHGFNLDGMEKYLREQMPQFIAGWSDERIRFEAFHLCYNPARHACYDEKGHALGGAGKSMSIKVVGMKGFRKDRRDCPDGRWITICPLGFGNGRLGFCGFVVQGKLQMDLESERASMSPASSPTTSPATRPAASSIPNEQGGSSRFHVNSSSSARLDCDNEGENPLIPVSSSDTSPPSLCDLLYGPDDTIFACSKSGYTNTVINLEFFKIGISRLKKSNPELFPFVLWLDNASPHCAAEFKDWCLQNGIILMFFRSHSTMPCCMLDNGSFGEYEKTYNVAILAERKEWGGKGRLPFWRSMRAVKKACDAGFKESTLAERQEENQEASRAAFQRARCAAA